MPRLSRRSASPRLLLVVATLATGPATVALARGAVEIGTQQVELQLLVPWEADHPLTAPLTTLVEQFNADNDGRATVTVEAIGDADRYERRLAALGPESEPTVVLLDPRSPMVRRADRLMDLKAELEGSWASSFVPGALAAVRGGQAPEVQLTVPFEYRMAPIWYHNGIFNAAGLDEFPGTATELATAVARLRAASATPAEVGDDADAAAYWFSYLAVSAGGPEVWDRPFTDAALLTAAEALQLLYWQPPAEERPYASGRVATTVADDRAIPALRGDSASVHAASRAARAPAVGEHAGFLLGSPVSALAATRSNDQRRNDAMLNLIRWLTLPANAVLLTEESGRMFAIRYSVVRNIDPMLAELMRATRAATSVALPFAAAHPDAPFAEALADLASGRATPDVFLTLLQSTGS